MANDFFLSASNLGMTVGVALIAVGLAMVLVKQERLRRKKVKIQKSRDLNIQNIRKRKQKIIRK